MIATLLPENIIPYLPLISKTLSSHPQIPILANILLDARKDGFYIKATDLEIGCEIKIPARIEEEGMVTVPGREFLETINTLPKDKIMISQDKDTLLVSCRDTKVSFNTISSTEFPQLYKEKGERAATFSREEFVDIFSCLTFSVSTEEARPQLTGVYINSNEKGIDFVSTDGYRMSVKTVNQKKGIDEGLIVAGGLISEIISLKGEDEIVLYINKKEGQVLFEVGEASVVGRMIEGQFPDYKKVLPTESATSVVVDREELLRSVRLTSVFAKESSNIINLAIEKDTIRLSTRSAGVGEGEAVVECEKEGEDNKISFNIKYLIDVIKTLPEKTITLKLNSPTEPAVFEVKEKDFVHVIMPIQMD